MSAELRDRPVEGRDGADAGRRPARVRRLPARARRRASSTGRFPTIMLHTPYDKTDKRYSEIADFFVPKGYNVVLIDLRDRYRSEASGVYYHAATPHTGRDGYDICEWIAAQPWSNGRIGTVGSSYAAITQVRTALERAAAPDGDLAGRGADEQLPEPVPRGRRDAAAHVLGALHPRAGRAGHRATTRTSSRTSGTTCATCGSSSARRRGSAGQTALRHVPPLEDSLHRLLHARRLRRVLGAGSSTTTRGSGTSTPTSRPRSRRGWYDPFPAADTEYFAAMTAQNARAAAARRRPVEPRRHARRRDVLPRRRLRPAERLGRAALLRGAARVLRPLAPGRRDRPAGRTRRRCGSSSWAAAPAAGPPRASSTTAAAGATSASGRSRARVETPYYLHGDGSLSTAPPPAGRGAAARSRSTPPTRCRRSAASTARSASCRPGARAWSRRGRGS